ncbi:hydrogenase iron-sulfur subunit [Thermodesulforhabdus norvegica]|uniref:F420-non-reducing hydrogenase subunit D n=1 Tax=Thermodesulforhabdus norvegica TaxID=39841 RepID=A0A1I4TH80_9BACT|nr:hydrogenase iron-sulfur subunit [Thermodesulforhabdus norvegica]SFM76059.1 F420-non-reducing hydrogenase subunit D [Thermodesulforhabdus norvegica]
MSAFEPKIVAFCCANCASAAAQVADKAGWQLPPNVRVVQLLCTGRLDSLHILKALENGADGVYVAGCQPDSCQFKHGVEKAEKKVKYVQKILEDIGLEPERVALFNVGAGKANRFVEIAREMVEKIKSLGPSPLKG